MNKNQKAVRIFFVITALTGLGLGLSDGVFANYFKDAYQIDAFQRGIIEIPRETPGVISLFIISGLAFLGDVKLSAIAQILSAVSLVVLGLYTPAFGVMLVFLFINSLGMHMFMPLGDSIGLSLAGKGSFGTMMGRFNGVRTAFTMTAGILVFVGFKTGFFSFTAPVKIIFLIAAFLFAVVFVLMIAIHRTDSEISKPKKVKIVIRKEYSTYYLISMLYGARKQIMFVYGPWVLIDLLGFGADTMALLAISGAAVGIFFIPAVGRWIDRFGTARIMTIEAACFFVIYIAYGVLSAGLHNGAFVAAGLTVVIAFILNMIDRMTMQFTLVRSVYMRRIALFDEDVTPTLSLGLTLDHTLSILSAVFCGWLWSEFGPQYVFVFAAMLSVANMAVARYCAKKEKVEKAV
ncbi:MAG: MFS transporter [Oscillospiraceae bacterium]|nr:MFS transporter [Oscillospiraceae bacterium]